MVFWSSSSPKTYVVIGAAGNLGRNIVETLLSKKVKGSNDDGKATIVAVDIAPYGNDDRVKDVVLDITDAKAVEKLQEILESSSNEVTVFHAASVIDIRPIPSPNMRKVNVEGTQNVIEACQKAIESKNITIQLIYTSSIEVVGGEDKTGKYMKLDGTQRESDVPYPHKHFLPYATSKADAEQMVLKANDPEHNLMCTSLRPGYIVGENCIGLKVEVVKAFEISATSPKYITAKVPAKFSCVSTKNCAVAHVLASTKMDKAVGKSFFLRDFEANIVDMNVECFQGTPIEPLFLPLWLATVLCWLVDRVERLLYFVYPLLGMKRITPPETISYDAMMLGYLDVRISTQSIQEDLGYGVEGECPKLQTEEEIMKETRDWTHTLVSELAEKHNSKAKKTN